MENPSDADPGGSNPIHVSVHSKRPNRTNSTSSNGHLQFAHSLSLSPERKREIGLSDWLCNAAVMVYYRGLLPTMVLFGD